ncbi:hypothetical protein [Phytobacter sp. V91]|uniref:hypothetical protein n=1 Tax=Phytobacter sp. V91 TaxID=3369425 RepID=UPI003F5F233E
MSEQKAVENTVVQIPTTLRNKRVNQNDKLFNELTADEQIAIILKRHREIVSSLVANA